MNPSPIVFCAPDGVASDGTRLYVADSAGNRVLGWNAIPSSSTTPADFAMGQPTGSANLTSAESQIGVVSGATFASPRSTSSDGAHLFVADRAAGRVLVWNAVPTSDGASAGFALGQPAGATNLTSFQENAGGVNGSSLTYPTHAFSDGTHLFVADTYDNRVLVWPTIPTSPTPASFALGQPNLTSTNYGTSGTSMSYPSAVWTDGTKLLVTDQLNNRVLVWNTMPTASVAADFALGQPAGSPNLLVNGRGNAAGAMYQPASVDSDGTRLVVSDGANNRVLIWNSIPTGPVPADVVIGQPGFGSSASGTTQTSLSNPMWAHSDGTKLYVADAGNNRVLVWSPIPTTNGAPASSVIGQPDFTSSAINQASPLGPSTLQFPTNVTTIGGHLFITDEGNNRTLIQ